MNMAYLNEQLLLASLHLRTYIAKFGLEIKIYLRFGYCRIYCHHRRHIYYHDRLRDLVIATTSAKYAIAIVISIVAIGVGAGFRGRRCRPRRDNGGGVIGVAENGGIK